jgi:hypothetical protein
MVNMLVSSAVDHEFEHRCGQAGDDDVSIELDQHAELEFHSANSLKQQSAGRHVLTLGHIILIKSQTVCPLAP